MRIERREHATLNASCLDSEIFIVTKNSTFRYQFFLGVYRLITGIDIIIVSHVQWRTRQRSNAKRHGH